MLRWGILGTSFISNTVAKSILDSPGSTITAVFGRDPSRLTTFAANFKILKTYQTVNELLDDIEVDVIYVGLPSHLHASATIEAAKRGKAILSEKSLATTMEDATAMIKAVEKANVFFLEGLMYLCHPFMEKVAEVIRSGVLGNIKNISGHYAANIWKKANPLGMGTIYNLGCYPVSLLHYVIEIALGSDAFRHRQVTGFGNLVTEQGVLHARDAALMVKFDAGVLATIQSTDSFGNDFGFTVHGDKAVMRFKTNPWLPVAGDNVIEIRPYGGEVELITISGEYDAFGYQVRKIEAYVAAKAKQAVRPSPSWSHSLEIMELLTEWENGIKARH